MRRISVYLVLGTAVLAALAVAACARDRGGPAAATDPAARMTAAVGEGARVRATVRDAVAAPGAAGEMETGVAAAEAVVRGGRAVDPATGALLAATDGGVDGEREFAYTDEGGHVHRMVLRGTPGRGPIASARYEEDGELVVEVQWRWEGRGGGWVLRDRTLTLHHHGRVLLRQVRRADAVDVTSAGAAAAAGFHPPVQMAQAMPCEREWGAYIGASAVLVVAGEMFTLMPTPATAAAVGAAATAWNQAFGNLVNCQLRAAGVIA